MYVKYKNINKNSSDEKKQIKNYISQDLFRKVSKLIHTPQNGTYIAIYGLTLTMLKY